MPYSIKGECRNTGRTRFKKGYIPWNKGKKLHYNVWNKGKKLPKIKKTCQRCEKEFEVYPSKKDIAKYCSVKCSPRGFFKGHKFRNTGRTRFKKGQISSRLIGRIFDKSGYVMIHAPKHPFATKNKNVYEHRLVVESQLNRYLSPEEKVHHLGKKDDNRPQMLVAFINDSAHQRFHHNINNVKPSEIIFDGRLLVRDNLN